MINKKVKDEKGHEYILLQFVVKDNEILAIIETLDGKIWTENYTKLRIVK